MPKDPIDAYAAALPPAAAAVCRALRAEIDRALPAATSKVWHGAPVWFVGETPVAGYSVKAKVGVALLFWNGQAFGDATLVPIGKFKAAEARYADVSEIEPAPLRRWLKKAKTELWVFRKDIPSKPKPKPAAKPRAKAKATRKSKATPKAR